MTVNILKLQMSPKSCSEKDTKGRTAQHLNFHILITETRPYENKLFNLFYITYITLYI